MLPTLIRFIIYEFYSTGFGKFVFFIMTILLSFEDSIELLSFPSCFVIFFCVYFYFFVFVFIFIILIIILGSETTIYV